MLSELGIKLKEFKFIIIFSENLFTFTETLYCTVQCETSEGDFIKIDYTYFMRLSIENHHLSMFP